jgi:hypothetical protein
LESDPVYARLGVQNGLASALQQRCEEGLDRSALATITVPLRIDAVDLEDMLGQIEANAGDDRKIGSCGWRSLGGSSTITPWRIGHPRTKPSQSAVHTITVIRTAASHFSANFQNRRYDIFTGPANIA